MAVKFILMMALIMVGSADPDEDINISVVQVVNPVENPVVDPIDGIGNRPSEFGSGKGCWFGRSHYSETSIIDACMRIECKNGGWYPMVATGWKPLSLINPKCLDYCWVGQRCDKPFTTQIKSYTTVNDDGVPFDLDGYYTKVSDGEFVLSQPGFDIPSSFGVNGYVLNNDNCISGITYYEPGINITMTPPLDTTYCNSILNAYDDPACAITVNVNRKEQPSLSAPSPTAGRFRAKYLTSTKDTNCMVVVGSKGFSVGLCVVYKFKPTAYIFALPKLKKKIYGWCNTYTPGTAAPGFINQQQHTMTKAFKCSSGCILNPAAAESWRYHN